MPGPDYPANPQDPFGLLDEGTPPPQPPPSEQPPSEPVARLRWVGGLALLAWMGLIAWVLVAPPQWTPNLEVRVPLGGGYYRPLTLDGAAHGPALMPVYRALFSLEGWSPGSRLTEPELALGIATGAAGLLLIGLVGWYLLRCFETYMPRLVELAFALVLGLGLCGLVYTFLALAGLLYQWLALLVYLLLLAATMFVSRRALRRHRLALSPEQPNLVRLSLSQRRNARLAEEAGWQRPRGRIDRALAALMRGAFVLISALIFYHALLYPPSYWDSLILYLGYARGIFLEHAFPVKVVGQVGVGLGANYPHLYELTGALIATWANRWSPLYQQLLAPLAGLGMMAFVYHTALRMTRSVLLALAVTLALRCLPYLGSYHVFASNYALVTLFCAAFCYAALRYIEDGLPGYLWLMALTCGFAMHINYLMGGLWVGFAATVFFAHWRRLPRAERPALHQGIVQVLHEDKTPEYCHVERHAPLLRALAAPWLWGPALAGMAIGAVWYLRNWIVTGNPVYAFFTGLFGGRHINPEVMASATREWQAHGDGIGTFDAPDTFQGLAALWNRVVASWPFFVNDFIAWKWGPIFMAVVVPGILVLLALLAWQLLRRGRPDDSTRFGAAVMAFVALLFAYHYLLGPFYLYHLFGAVACFGVFLTFAWRGLPRWLLRAAIVWLLLVVAMPALPFSLIGYKFMGRSQIGPHMYRGPDLVTLKQPGMDEFLFYRLVYGQAPLMWRQVNRLARGQGLLTHENRHLVFEPDVRLVHMDDWEVQQVWDAPREEKLRRLRELGVRWYLEVPYEFDHPVNARLGHREWIGTPLLQKVFEAGDQRLYRFHYPE